MSGGLHQQVRAVRGEEGHRPDEEWPKELHYGVP